MTIANGWKPLTIITRRSILDVAVVLDPPLEPFAKIVQSFGHQLFSQKVPS